MAATTETAPPAFEEARFRCCDTAWSIGVAAPDSQARLAAARQEAFRLEARLNAFDDRSAVSLLNRKGEVRDPTVAAVVRRALAFRDRTGGAFDIAQGRLEHHVKAYIRGQAQEFAPRLGRNRIELDGDVVRATAPVDLNGIAKGWMADRVWETLTGSGAVAGFVDAGGDISHPQGRVAIDAPGGGTVAVLDTAWNVATSGTSNRRRGTVSHLYDPRTGHAGASQQQVTVLSAADACEADVLATVLCVLPPEQALGLASAWGGVEALFIRNGEVWWTGGFESHVA